MKSLCVRFPQRGRTLAWLQLGPAATLLGGGEGEQHPSEPAPDHRPRFPSRPRAGEQRHRVLLSVAERISARLTSHSPLCLPEPTQFFLPTRNTLPGFSRFYLAKPVLVAKPKLGPGTHSSPAPSEGERGPANNRRSDSWPPVGGHVAGAAVTGPWRWAQAGWGRYVCESVTHRLLSQTLTPPLHEHLLGFCSVPTHTSFPVFPRATGLL